MNVNDKKWFRSMGAEKLMEAEEREREVKDMAEIKEAAVLEVVPSDTVIIDKKTGEKMILITTTSTDESDYYLAVNKDGDLVTGSVKGIKLLLSNEQKKLLE